MTVYRYFLGCVSYAEVKVKYKELVKIHHPDKSTGSHQAFVALQAEYEMLGDGDYYPIKNTRDMNWDRVMQNPFREYPKTYQEATHLDSKELEKQRATNYFNQLRLNDATFDVIDQVIARSKKDQLTRLWVYQEIQKQWDLNLDHFKYLTFKLGDNVMTANTLFKKYQLSKV